MRRRIIELRAASGRPVVERRISLSDLLEADSVFLSNTLIGIWPVRRVVLPDGGRDFESLPIAQQLREALEQ
jgi:4-amino-4-deoxychorismate lyase